MTITSLPTRGALDLGATLTNTRTPTANELSAVNVERIKDRIIEIASEVGLTDGSTAGSLRAALNAAVTAAADSIHDADFAGSHVGVLIRTAAGTYEARRYASESGLLGLGHATPLVTDDSSLGFGQGSIWVQRPTDGSASLGIWICMDPAVGAAVWTRIDTTRQAVTPATVGRANSAGSEDRAARADHTHDGATRSVVAITSSVSMTEKDVHSVDTTSGAVTLTLPVSTATGTTSREFEIVKSTLSTNSITIARSGSDTIRGLSASLMLPGSDLYARGSWRIRAVGTNWTVVGHRIDYPEPIELSGLVGDWRAESGVTLASGRASAWLDSAGSGRSFVQATAGNQPLYRATGAPSGRPSLYFGRSRPDYMTLANEAAWSTITDWTVLVYGSSYLQSGTLCLISKSSGGAAQPFDFQCSANYTLGLGPTLAGASMADPAAQGTMGPNGPPCFAWAQIGFVTGSGTAVRVIENGRTMIAGTHTRTAGSNPIWLGHRQDLPASSAWSGEIARVVIYSRALSDAEIQGVSRSIGACYCA